jgi:hypothetical protein
MLAPAGSPAAFVVACRKYIWHAAGTINSGQPDNDDSIGLVVRFGNFFFYTGGDLPSPGEDLIAAAVMANGFANPAGGAFPVAGRIAAFKCGHHGSGHSTSAAFLAAVNPVVATISCGENQFGTGENHPDPAVIGRLQATAGLYFYLTNCKYATTHIPASEGTEQLSVVGNRSRVSGNNDIPNLTPGRDRGNIRLFLSQAESVAAAGPARQFHVEYWENDDAPAVVGMPAAVIGLRTENHQF